MTGLSDRRERWKTYSSRREHLVIGLMSGTSLDGVDAALVKIQSEASGLIQQVELVDYVYVPYSDDLKKIMISLCSAEHARIDDLVYAHYGVSEWYAYAVDKLIAVSGRASSEIEAISMHGQTVWHAPDIRMFPGPEQEFPVRGTLQIGESAVLQERTGIPVVSNLRAGDIAAGGEGAPLAPYLDALLFGSPVKGRIVQNIGGIGNATVIPANASLEDISAFDTGPGNMIIDAVVRKATDGREHYDPSGRYAALGRVSQEVLDLFLEDDYFRRKPPKSTGREVYGAGFTERFMQEAAQRSLSFEDTVATATAFTAETIARAYLDFIMPNHQIDEVFICGGGALNVTLLQMISQRLPAHVVVTTTASLGVPDQAREAMAFAVLGHESLMGRPSNLPAVTGARRPVVLGSITL